MTLSNQTNVKNVYFPDGACTVIRVGTEAETIAENEKSSCTKVTNKL